MNVSLGMCVCEFISRRDLNERTRISQMPSPVWMNSIDFTGGWKRTKKKGKAEYLVYWRQNICLCSRLRLPRCCLWNQTWDLKSLCSQTSRLWVTYNFGFSVHQLLEYRLCHFLALTVLRSTYYNRCVLCILLVLFLWEA